MSSLLNVTVAGLALWLCFVKDRLHLPFVWRTELRISIDRNMRLDSSLVVSNEEAIVEE